ALSFPPPSRVVAVVAIVAHDPDFLGLDLVGTLVVTAEVGPAGETGLAVGVTAASATFGRASRAHRVVEEREEGLVAEVFDEQFAAVLRERSVAPGMLVDADFALGRAPAVDDRTAVESFELVARKRHDALDEVLLGALGK